VLTAETVLKRKGLKPAIALAGPIKYETFRLDGLSPQSSVERQLEFPIEAVARQDVCTKKNSACAGTPR